MKAPLPSNETARLAALRACRILDTPAEEAFDDLARLAADLCGVPIALVSLVDGQRQWLKAKVGIDVCETSRDVAFCAHAILERDLMLVPDAAADPRFADNPLVTGEPKVRFYAGMPIVTAGGHAVGTICVIDRIPRSLSDEQAEGLRAMGRQVARMLERRRPGQVGIVGSAVAPAVAGKIGPAVRADARPPGRRLRKLYVCALGTIALILVAGQVLVQRSLGALEADGRVINVAGRQRMLSQQLTKEALALLAANLHADSSGDLAQRAGRLEKTLALWTISHHGLQQGDAAMGLPGGNPPAVAARFAGIEPHFRAMVAAAGEVIQHCRSDAAPDAPALRRAADALLAQNEPFLVGMNDIVFAYEAAARQKILRLKMIEAVLAGGILLVLAAEMLLVFDPAVRMLNGQWANLSEMADRTRIDRAVLATQSETKKLALVASSTDNAVVITDADGRIEWVNEGFTRVTEYSLDEVKGKKPGAVLQGPETDPETVAAVRAKLREGRAFENEIVNYSKSGRKYWLAISVQPIHDEFGRLTNFIAIESDITGRKAAEAALTAARDAAEAAKDQAEAANRAKSEFLAAMSHELRTPLNGVTGAADLLEQTDLDPQQRNLAGLIRTSGDALLGVISDVLDFSKIEAGKLELEALAFDPAAVVDDAVAILRPKAAAKGLEIGAVIDPAVPRSVVGDAGRLRQVVINLINNATKFTDRGQITVRVQPAGSAGEGRCALKISVIDTGIGIPPERLDRLFKSFSQVDASTTRKYGGTGLGLAICQKIAAAMNGTIGVESVPGEGSTFWFTVDLELAEAETPEVPPALVGRRVLLVEGNAVQREAVGIGLRAAGLEVVECESLDAACETLGAGGKPFGLVLLATRLTDVGPGRLLPALQRLAAAGPEDAPNDAAPVVLLTANRGGHADARENAAGVRGCVDRPVRQSRLLGQIAAALAADATREKPSAEPTLVASDAPRPRVLLAEDHPINEVVAVTMLQQAGYDVDVAPDGAKAVRAALARAYDAVLMDCQMPEMDGFEATARIRAAEAAGKLPGRPPGSPRLPILALTANAIKGDRERCLAAGMDEHLTKPLDRKAVLASIASLLGERGRATVEQTPPAASRSEGDPFDLPSLLERCGGSGAFVGKILAMFETQTVADVRAAETAVASGDAAGLAAAAHRLKGCAANCSAPEVQAAAAELESQAHGGDLSASARTLDKLRAAAARCSAAAGGVLAELAPAKAA